MSNAAVLRGFLLSLGFDVDASGERKMASAMEGMEKKAKLLNAAFIGMATAAVVAVAKTANELEKLYYASDRIGASAENIRGFEAAISQLGGSGTAALQSLENVARKMRESAGYEGMLKGLGVATRDQNGAMRDRVDVMQDLAKSLKGMDYSKANAYANSLGIDENTLMAMRDGKFNDNLSKYQKLQKEMGLDNGLAESGKEFATEARDVTMTLKALTEVVVMTAGKALIPVLKIVNTGLQGAIKWFKDLNPSLKTFLATGLKIGTLLIVFGGLFAIISKLALVLPILRGIIFLIRAMSLAFLMSPIGLVVALAAAIGLLWDDYQTWKNGGDSLIDWGKWSGGIDSAIKGIKSVIQWLKDLSQAAIDFTAGAFDKVVNWVSNKIMPTVAPIIEKTIDAIVGDPVKPKTAAKAVESAIVAANVALGAGGAGLANLGKIIASGEGGYNSVNRGLVKGKNLGSYETDLSKMSINEIIARNKLPAGDENRMNAVGKYQIIRTTLESLVKKMGLSGDEKFTPELQERIFKDGLLAKRPTLKKFIDTGAGSMDDAIYDASKEWASIAVPAGYKTESGRVSDGTMTYYDKTKGNRAKKGSYAAMKTALGAFVRGQRVELPKDPEGLAKFANGAASPPVGGNPHKDQTNAVGAGGNTTTHSISINQKTDIHVTGGSDPYQAGLAVRREQEAVNFQMARNAEGAIV